MKLTLFVFIILIIFKFTINGINFSENKENNSTIFYQKSSISEILFLKSINGFNSHLVALNNWISSHRVNNISQNRDNFYNFYLKNILFEPYFNSMIRYSATYLESILEEPHQALELVKTAKNFDKNNFNINYLEYLLLIKIINSEKNISEKNYNLLLNLAEKLTQKDSTFAKKWLFDTVVYLKNRKNLSQEKLKSLEWLYKNSISTVEKNKIQEKLKKF